MYLSYSGFALYQNCRRAYYYRYLSDAKPPAPNCVHMLYGDVVGKLFEKFYQDRLWQNKLVVMTMLDLVQSVLNKVIIQERKKGGTFDWQEPGLKPGTRSLEEVEEEIRETIPRGIRSIKHHRLGGIEADAEVVLDEVVEGHKIGGRADFIIRRVRPHNDLVIVDGKGSRWREKYTDNRQLRWYAMLYWLKHGVIPDRLGFLYWRFEPEKSMDWSEVTKNQLEALLEAVLETIKEIEVSKRKIRRVSPETVFWATPGSNCKLCNYQVLCTEGSRALSDNTKTQILEDAERGVEEGEVSF